MDFIPFRHHASYEFAVEFDVSIKLRCGFECFCKGFEHNGVYRKLYGEFT